MSKDYSKYLQFLASEYNILYIGKDSEEIYDETSSYFKTTSKIDINKEMLEKIVTVLIKRHVTLVVIDVQDNNKLAVDFYKKIRASSEDILILLMFNPKEYKKLFEIVPLVDATVSYPIDKDIFHKRLFMVLSRTYAINSIGRREIVLKQDNTTQEESIDRFFDTYEGSSLFIADDLMDMVNALNSGNLTHQFLINIADKLDEIAEIFSKAEQTKSVTPIYEELASYIRRLNLEKIEPQNLKGFTYLSEILSDVSVYLMDMFVDRIFKDVYIFEHSLQSNIEFMENTLKGNQEDRGELDFF
ncbi:MAG: hypothetical protein L3J44_01050 [Campylobacteraceae bacterium]|nr:hypothetical protein [Campylobacteraceae bacterium]